MEYLWQAVCWILIIYFVYSKIKGKKKKDRETEQISYINDKNDIDDLGTNYRQKFILTKNEYAFYMVLRHIATEQKWIICPKVDLKEIFEVANKDSYMKYFGTIAQKNVDFLICDDKLRPKYAIELNDNSHNSLDRQKSDSIKQAIFSKSTIKLVAIKAQQSYTENYIRQFFDLQNVANSSEEYADS